MSLNPKNKEVSFQSQRTASIVSAASSANTSRSKPTIDGRSVARSSQEDAGEEKAPSLSTPSKKEESKEGKQSEAQLAGSSRDYDPLEVIPEEYRKHGANTEPMLYYIRQKTDEEDLDSLLEAAQRDIRLHRARIRAVLSNNPALLATYDYAQDPSYLARQDRKKERIATVENLTREAKTILKELDEEKKNLTPAERTQVKLARWQRALELYVYCPSEMGLDLLGLLEKLLNGTSEVRIVQIRFCCTYTKPVRSSQIPFFVYRNKNYQKCFLRLPTCAPVW